MVEIEDVDPAREPARAALLTLGDGIVGTRADSPGSDRGRGRGCCGDLPGRGAGDGACAASGLESGPARGGATRRRVLDLRDGTLRTELDTPGGEASR